MMRDSLKALSTVSITLFSLQAFAENNIRITVKTSENTAAGIGYAVEGRTVGTLGKTYTGKGVSNKKYVFGYRKNSIAGTDITCGATVLTKDSTVTLVTKGDQCQIVISD